MYFGGFLDEHRNSEHKHINPTEYVSTFSCGVGNVVHRSYLGRNFIVYENPYFRYLLNNIEIGFPLDIIHEMASAYPVHLPTNVNKDPDSWLLQRKMQVNIDFVQDPVQLKLMNKLTSMSKRVDEKKKNDLEKKVKNQKFNRIPEDLTKDQKDRIKVIEFPFIDVFSGGSGGGSGDATTVSSSTEGTAQLPSRTRPRSEGSQEGEEEHTSKKGRTGRE